MIEKPATQSIDQNRAKAERLAAAFAEVFGQPRGRTDAQKRVASHLEACSGGEGNAFNFNGSARDGMTIAFAAAQIDGAQSILRIIKRQLSLAAKSKAITPEKPRVIKS